MSSVWLIVGGVTLIVAGSIFWILPSPRDRQRMVLRQCALNQGFRVKQMKPEEIAEQFGIKNQEAQMCLYFKPGFYGGYQERYSEYYRLIALANNGNWQLKAYESPGKEPEILQEEFLFDQLGGTVKAVVMSKREIGLLWTEYADKEAAEGILNDLAAMLA